MASDRGDAMKRVCLLVVLLLATMGLTSVIGQDQRPFTGIDPTRLLTVAPEPAEVAGQELFPGGDELLSRCEQALGEQPGPRDTFAASVCLSLVRGVFDMTALTRNLRVCSPTEVTVIQAVRVVVTYLNDHPEELHERDTRLILRALQDAFPCQ